MTISLRRNFGIPIKGSQSGIFDGTANTADRTYTLPDTSGAVVVDTTFATVNAATIHAATSKATPVDADETPIVDSEAANVLKKVTWANVKATLKAYFDGLYSTRKSLFDSGYYYSFTSSPSDTTASPGANSLQGGAYFYVDAATTFDMIGVEVTTAVASSTVRLGIYSVTNSLPTTLVLDAGTVDSSTTGVKQIVISQQLTKGSYILVAVQQGGGSSVAFRARYGGYGVPPPQTAIASVNNSGFTSSSVSGSLPNSPSWSINQSACPKVMVRAA